jgi:hypothetical protein
MIKKLFFFRPRMTSAASEASYGMAGLSFG